MNNKAFTLIEFLIIIAITIILSSFGVMNLVSQRQERDLDFTAKEIITVLRNAQDRSISQEERSGWGVRFNSSSTGASSYELFKGLNYASVAVISKIILRSNIQLHSSSTIVFAPLTGLPNTSTIIKISLMDKPISSSTIIINNNGGIYY